MTPRCPSLGRIVVAILGLLLVPAATRAQADPQDPFPIPEEIRGNVEFWKRVFAEWPLGQVVVHDSEHPELVYEVADLPGPIGDSYTEGQREFASDRRDAWRLRLQKLSADVAAGAELSDGDKALALAILTKAGSTALPGAHDRVRTQRGLRERFLAGLERSSRWLPDIREALRERQLPEDLAYLPHVESSFQPSVRSSAGAVGLWQLTRDAARRHGLTVGYAVDERLDPISATEGAAGYLADSWSRFGSWPLVITSYNHGVGGMTRAAAQFGQDFGRIYREYAGPLFGFASKNFYAEFLAVREIASDPTRFFPEGFRPEPPLAADELWLPHPTTSRMLAETYGVDRDELAAANPAWTRRAVTGHLALPQGIRVWLPQGTLERLARAGDVPVPPRVAASASGEYVVRRGDTLARIASRHGISLAEMRRVNGIRGSGNVIRVGQRLRVPGSAAASSVVHRVRAGETLSTIAASLGTSADELRRLNGIAAGGDLIHVGQRLRVPAGVTPDTTTAAVSRGAATHVVAAGESLFGIAAAHGLDVAQLRAVNGIRSDLIHPGQVLQLAGSDAATRHVVRRGETLGRIAARYGVRLMDLLTANHLTVRSIIRPGQSLLIPH